jgi:IS30 family transposase
MDRPERQQQIARLKSEGRSNRGIAKLIGCDEGTVRNDLRDYYSARKQEYAEMEAVRGIVAVAVHKHRQAPHLPPKDVMHAIIESIDPSAPILDIIHRRAPQVAVEILRQWG